MQSTIFNNRDIDLYFLNFLSIKQINIYCFLSKSTLSIFNESKYSKEIVTFKKIYKEYNFSRVCEIGCLSLVKVYLKECIIVRVEDVICTAMNGNLEVIKYFAYIGINIMIHNNLVFRWIICTDNFKIIRYFIYLGVDINENRINAIKSAIVNGDLEIVKYLVFQGVNLIFDFKSILQEATRNNRSHIYKYLISTNDTIEFYNFAFQLAAEKGYLESMYDLCSKGITSEDNFAVIYAVECGQLESVKFMFLMEPHLSSNDFTLQVAVENKRLDVIKYLIYLNVDINADDNYAIYYAIENGFLKIVKYLISLNFVTLRHVDIFPKVVKNNLIKMVKYLSYLDVNLNRYYKADSITDMNEYLIYLGFDI